jgi:hypothetical protein
MVISVAPKFPLPGGVRYGLFRLYHHQGALASWYGPSAKVVSDHCNGRAYNGLSLIGACAVA